MAPRKRKKQVWSKDKKKNQFTKQQLQAMSKRNAYKIMTGTDNLKSWGKSGWYKSEKLNEWFQYRSSIELRTLEILDDSDHILDFDTEALAIPYDWKGMECNYIPDIILRTRSAKTFIVEVKPKSKLKDARNKAKWAAAKRWCWVHDCKFIVITEKDNEKLEQILKYLEDDNSDQAQKLIFFN